MTVCVVQVIVQHYSRNYSVFISKFDICEARNKSQPKPVSTPKKLCSLALQ